MLAQPHPVTLSSGDDQGSDSNPWTIEYTGLEPSTEYTVTVTGPDGQLTQVTFTTDHTGSTIARITWSDGSVPGGTTLSAALTSPGGESVPGVEQSLTTPEDEVVPTPEPTAEPTEEPTTETIPDPISETTSTGDDQGSATSPWTIRYEHLTPDAEYTVVVTGPGGQVTTATFRTDAEGTGGVAHRSRLRIRWAADHRDRPDPDHRRR